MGVPEIPPGVTWEQYTELQLEMDSVKIIPPVENSPSPDEITRQLELRFTHGWNQGKAEGIKEGRLAVLKELSQHILKLQGREAGLNGQG